MTSGTKMSGGDEGSNDKHKWAESKVYMRKSFKGLKNDINVSQLPQTQILPLEEDVNVSQQFVGLRSEGSSGLNRGVLGGGSGMGKLGGSRQENSGKVTFSFKSKQEMRELRSKLQNELDLIRSLVKKIEAKDVIKTGSGISKSGVQRIHADVSQVGPLHQLSVSVVENSHGVIDNVEKEKRTPKANQFYRNSEFLLAKDKFPPADNNKKSKSNAKKVGGVELGHGSGVAKFSNQVLKNCRLLLERLMKHKHGWVFNQPVDIEALGLQDYFDIIKSPMDLGTVKSRLDTNWYKSPREFAEDVRLTFQNAMTYNPKGQDVHMMAEQVSKIFEDKWVTIEADYMRELRLATDCEVRLPTHISRKAPPTTLPPPDKKRTLDRSESTTHPIVTKPKSINLPQSGRTPAPKKPKAKDPNKREMTYDEKQKLSSNLQNLPSEKLENVVQIIKKGNSSLCQQDDEIEVDIDSVDTETLWELDRFVTNFKKNLSKKKRKAEVANPTRRKPKQNIQKKSATAVVLETPKVNKAEKKSTSSAPAQDDKQGNDASSSSSSTDSGSSSNGSDSEGSSGSGSDAEHSPKS